MDVFPWFVGKLWCVRLRLRFADGFYAEHWQVNEAISLYVFSPFFFHPGAFVPTTFGYASHNLERVLSAFSRLSGI